MRIGIDCEFSFDADNEFVLVCAAATQEDGETHTWWYDQLDELKAYIESHKADTWVAHNVETAEGYMFQSLGLRPTKFRWHDTLMLSRVAHNSCAMTRMKHDLASCLEREHIAKIDKDEKHDNQYICVWEQDCSWEDHIKKLEANKELLLKYCLSDTAYLLPLDEKLVAKVHRHLLKPLDKAKPLEKERRADYFGFLTAIASEISWNGIPLDENRVKKLLSNAPKALSKLQVAFSKKYPESFRTVGKKLTKNVAKCREYASKVYGSHYPTTKTGEVSLASEHTKKHKDLDDFLGDYYNLDKKCRALASFSKSNREKNWLGMYLRKRGVIRPRLNILGTQTGRCGSKPSTGFVYVMGKAFRGLINPPEGYVIVELDYHSEEIGCQAYLSGDTTMAKMYEGPDYYTSIAQKLDPTVKDKHDPKRKKYKVISLMSNYGCGKDHLAEIAKIPVDEAGDILRDLKKLFKVYWNYVHKRIEMCDEGSYMCFSDGLRITNRGGKVTTLGNWPFQGVGALILRKLLIGLYKENIRVVAPIHDAIAFMCKESEWKEKAETVSQLMRDVSKECLGTQVDVGEPEVTFHDFVNCHSELCDRESYKKLYEEVKKYDEKYQAKLKDDSVKISDAETYLHEYITLMSDVDCDIIGDSVNLYVDEEWLAVDNS